MDLLTVEHVTKRYASHTALDDVSLAIPKGSVYGLLGPNGAGKTTLIRIINRITAPDAGRVLFGDREIAPDDIYRIGYLPEERGLYKKMKVGEQAVFFARLKGLSRREAVVRLKQWFVRFGIQEWWDKKVEELSKGMAQKVQFTYRQCCRSTRNCRTSSPFWVWKSCPMRIRSPYIVPVRFSVSCESGNCTAGIGSVQ